MKLMTFIKDNAMKPLMRRVKGIMDDLEDSVLEMPGSHRFNEDSAERFDLVAAALELEGDHAPMPGFPWSMRFVVGSFRTMVHSLRSLSDNPPNAKTRISNELLAEIVAVARAAGADEIGFTTVPREWVFRDKAVAFPNAIVFMMEMDKARMAKAPNRDTAVMVHETYYRLGWVTDRVTEFLRDNGHNAHAGHPLNGLALYPPLGQMAGLGWRGMSGLLITPRFGPRVRLAAVFTDIENLPFSQENPHGWIDDYCQICQVCVQQCPVDAIYTTPIEHPNGLATCVDSDLCLPYFAMYHGCSICIKVCPFNLHSYSDLHQHIIDRQPVSVPLSEAHS
jgi:NAD-dependent dihydropyrimidine dehydrogenase PreA subunit